MRHKHRLHLHVHVLHGVEVPHVRRHARHHIADRDLERRQLGLRRGRLGLLVDFLLCFVLHWFYWLHVCSSRGCLRQHSRRHRRQLHRYHHLARFRCVRRRQLYRVLRCAIRAFYGPRLSWLLLEFSLLALPFF